MAKIAFVEYEKLLHGPEQDSNELIISAYEAVLTNKRTRERLMLN